jgi:hypothetical protein
VLYISHFFSNLNSKSKNPSYSRTTAFPMSCGNETCEEYARHGDTTFSTTKHYAEGIHGIQVDDAEARKSWYHIAVILNHGSSRSFRQTQAILLLLIPPKACPSCLVEVPYQDPLSSIHFTPLKVQERDHVTCLLPNLESMSANKTPTCI